MRIFNCKTNHLTRPLGFMTDKPVFSWEVGEAKSTFIRESAVRLFEGDRLIFDSGFQSGIDRLGYEADAKLKPRTAYFWTVSVRTDAGEEATSDKNPFETGKHGEAWQGKWISCAESCRPKKSPSKRGCISAVWACFTRASTEEPWAKNT